MHEISYHRIDTPASVSHAFRSNLTGVAVTFLFSSLQAGLCTHPNPPPGRSSPPAFHSRMVGLICFMIESPRGMRIPPYSTAALGVLDSRKIAFIGRSRKRALWSMVDAVITFIVNFAFQFYFHLKPAKPILATHDPQLISYGTRSSHSGRSKTSVTRRGISQETYRWASPRLMPSLLLLLIYLVLPLVSTPIMLYSSFGHRVLVPL